MKKIEDFREALRPFVEAYDEDDKFNTFVSVSMTDCANAKRIMGETYLTEKCAQAINLADIILEVGMLNSTRDDLDADTLKVVKDTLLQRYAEFWTEE